VRCREANVQSLRRSSYLPDSVEHQAGQGRRRGLCDPTTDARQPPVALTDPPLKLLLLDRPGRGGSFNHLGVEVSDTDAVEAE
jgi:hypothetical protein